MDLASTEEQYTLECVASEWGGQAWACVSAPALERFECPRYQGAAPQQARGRVVSHGLPASGGSLASQAEACRRPGPVVTRSAGGGSALPPGAGPLSHPPDRPPPRPERFPLPFSRPLLSAPQTASPQPRGRFSILPSAPATSPEGSCQFLPGAPSCSPGRAFPFSRARSPDPLEPFSRSSRALLPSLPSALHGAAALGATWRSALNGACGSSSAAPPCQSH